MLKVSNLNVEIQGSHIIRNLSLEVRPGELVCLLGRNGAGKTTTLRTIMGLWQASAGRITLSGRDITATATADLARAGVAYVPENMGIFADLSVRENLLLAARQARTLRDLDGARLDWIFELFPAMKKFWLHPAGKLSGGQKQMLAVARAIVEPRQLLLIDEPSKGLAPAMIQNMITAFRALKEAQTTILLVEQNFNFARQLGDRVAVMDDGRVVHSGAMADLVADEALQARLLGLSLGAHQ